MIPVIVERGTRARRKGAEIVPSLTAIVLSVMGSSMTKNPVVDTLIVFVGTETTFVET